MLFRSFLLFFYMDIDVKLWGDTSPIENLLREDKNQVAIHERNLISKAPKCRTIGFFCVVCSVIEGRTVCCRVGRECIILFSDFFFFCVVFLVSIPSAFLWINGASFFVFLFYYNFWLICYVSEAPILKTKEGIFKCASLKTKQNKKKLQCVFCRYAVEGESRVLRFACPLLSFTSPPIPPSSHPGFPPPIMLLSAFSQGPGLLIPTVVNTVFV